MTVELVRNRGDELLWNMLGVVELTYHPALAVAVLLVVNVVVSPVPVVRFDPLSIAVSGQGLPITTLFAVVVLVDMASDVAGVWVTDWAVVRRDGDE
ncbi:MAG: hypothetical protein ABEH88_07265 [Halobacteriales archaeon]